jgi:hypothetical protein
VFQLAHVFESLYGGVAVRAFEMDVAENEIDTVTQAFAQEIVARTG